MAKILKTEEMSKCIGCFTCMLVCAAVNSKSHSIYKSGISVRTSGGLSGRFIAVVCQACLGPQCAKICPSGALFPRKGGGVNLDARHCLGCGRCKNACIVHAIGFDKDERLPIVCRHCGLCARYCPHGCLEMQEVPDEPSREVPA